MFALKTFRLSAPGPADGPLAALTATGSRGADGAPGQNRTPADLADGGDGGDGRSGQRVEVTHAGALVDAEVSVTGGRGGDGGQGGLGGTGYSGGSGGDGGKGGNALVSLVGTQIDGPTWLTQRAAGGSGGDGGFAGGAAHQPSSDHGVGGSGGDARVTLSRVHTSGLSTIDLEARGGTGGYGAGADWVYVLPIGAWFHGEYYSRSGDGGNALVRMIEGSIDLVDGATHIAASAFAGARGRGATPYVASAEAIAEIVATTFSASSALDQSLDIVLTARDSLRPLISPWPGSIRPPPPSGLVTVDDGPGRAAFVNNRVDLGAGDDVLSLTLITGVHRDQIISGNILDGTDGYDVLRLDARRIIQEEIYWSSDYVVTTRSGVTFGPDNTVLGFERITGSSRDDTIFSGAGDETLEGGGGDDRLAGREGADRLDGGDGFDVADYSLSSTGVTVELHAGRGQNGEATGDVLISIEAVVGSAFGDGLAGSPGADRLDGGDGDDHLYGGAGDDLLIGGGGADRIEGQSGFDTADYSASSAGVSIDLLRASARGGQAEGDVLLSIERLIGSGFDDALTGARDAETLEGGLGDDRLEGGAGDDLLLGGAGGDRLVGGAGDDRLAGGAGRDVLEGGAGDDRLTGGVGDDLFVFRSRSGADIITDFKAGAGSEDVICFASGSFSSFREVKDHAVNDGQGNCIIARDGVSICLIGVSRSDLSREDFVFVSSSVAPSGDWLV